MRRVVGLAVAVVAALIVFIVAAGNADTNTSDITGDALYTAAVWGGLVLLFPRWPSWVAGGVALAWCDAVELCQLTGLPLRWAGEWAPSVLVFGTSFDPRDLLVYAVAAVVLTGVDAVARRAFAGRCSGGSAAA